MQSQPKGQSSRKNEDEFTDEEVLVYVNFEDFTEEPSDEDLRNCKILGVDTNEPIMQIGSKVYGGSWKEAIGTAVFFEESEPTQKKCYFSVDVPKPLKYAAKTQKVLNMNRVFVSAKDASNMAKVVTEDDEEEQMKTD